MKIVNLKKTKTETGMPQLWIEAGDSDSLFFWIIHFLNIEFSSSIKNCLAYLDEAAVELEVDGEEIEIDTPWWNKGPVLSSKSEYLIQKIEAKLNPLVQKELQISADDLATVIASCKILLK